MPVGQRLDVQALWQRRVDPRDKNRHQQVSSIIHRDYLHQEFMTYQGAGCKEVEAEFSWQLGEVRRDDYCRMPASLIATLDPFEPSDVH